MKKTLVFLCGVVVATAMMTLPTSTYAQPFAEVFVWLSANGLTTVTTQAAFRENDRITRGEAAKFINEYAQLKGLQKSYTNCTFTDLEGYDTTLTPHIQEACAYGFLKGSKGKFMPNDPITEAQASAMVVRTLVGFMDETKAPWYADYFTKMNDDRCILMENETMVSVASTPITRGKMGTWLYMVAELESPEDDMCQGKKDVHEGYEENKMPTDEITTWKIYHNLQLGIQFHYPENWIVYEEVTEYNNRIYIASDGSQSENVLSMRIDYRKPSSETMSYEDQIRYFDDISAKKEIINESLEIYTYEVGYNPNSERSGVGPYLEAVWEDDSWIYNASTADWINKDDNEAKVKILKQILSTMIVKK